MKKRVLVFVPEFPVISETFIERELAELAKSPQIELAIYALKKGRGEVSESLNEHIKYIQVTFLDIIQGKIKFLFASSFRFFEAFKLVGIKNIYLFSKSLGYAKIFSEFCPDIVYAHFMSESSTIGLIASILLDSEFAVSAHARDVLEYPDLPAEKLKKAKFITICNKNAYEHYLTLCESKHEINELDTKKVHLLYHGIPDLFDSTMSIAPIVNENISATKTTKVKKLLIIGRLVEKKGIVYLLEAFKWLINKFPDYIFELTIIGDGPLSDSLKEHASKLGLQGSAFFKGALPFSETQKFLNSTDIYVQPSINMISGDADGIPNTLIEAAMAKLPIVTTDAGSISEFLDNSNAVITAQKDARSLANGISILIERENVAKTIAEKAYTKAKQMFDVKTNIAKIEELLLK